MEPCAELFIPGAKEPRRIPAGQTILRAVESAGLHFDQPVVALVNGQIQDLNYRLQAGDVVRLLYQIAGGAQ